MLIDHSETLKFLHDKQTAPKKQPNRDFCLSFNVINYLHPNFVFEAFVQAIFQRASKKPSSYKHSTLKIAPEIRAFLLECPHLEIKSGFANIAIGTRL